jgi:hypothetical protein
VRSRMRKCKPLILATVLGLPALAFAGDKHMHETASPQDPPIQITINSEARVSVTLAGALPPAAPCGTTTNLSVKIVNRGFVTARLEADLVGDAPAGVTLDFHPTPLKGLPEEERVLRITLAKPGPTDVTIAFRAHNEAPDLGGRNRVHFLMDCLPVHDHQGSIVRAFASKRS